MKVMQGGDVLYRTLRVHAPGTYATLASTVPTGPKPRTVSNRPDDALDVQMFTGSGSRTTPSYRIRGAENIVAELARRGVEVSLDAQNAPVVTGAGI